MTPNRHLQHCPLEIPSTHSPVRYQVEVGHWSLEVDATSRAAAIAAARKQLCQQLPRLWDVIHSLPASRFAVTSEVFQRNDRATASPFAETGNTDSERHRENSESLRRRTA